jgi:hypothetical protein
MRRNHLAAPSPGPLFYCDFPTGSHSKQQQAENMRGWVPFLLSFVGGCCFGDVWRNCGFIVGPLQGKKEFFADSHKPIGACPAERLRFIFQKEAPASPAG